MKTKLTRRLGALALLALFTVNPQLSTAFAQGTAFTYQGRLNTGGSPANGLYDYRFKLYADPLGNTQVGSSYSTNAIAVTNGLFTTTIDFGSGIFTGGTNWLEVDVRTNNAPSYTASYAVLNPFQQVTPTPNAIFAETANNLSGTVASASLSGTYGSAVTLNNSGNSISGSFTGNGVNVSNVNASALNGLSASNFWQLGGNNVLTGQFLGSTNSQPLIIMVNGLEAERFEPQAGNPPNIVGGFAGNFVSGVFANGVTIGGGGTSGYTNSIQGTNVTFATIAGGVGNTISGANTYHSAIGGGFLNTIGGYNAYESTIAGGYSNVIASQNGFVGGGYVNTIQTNSPYSFIGGGHYNTIQPNTYGSVIGGGYDSMIETNADHSVIGGGWQNQIQPFGYESVIGGGELNIIGPGAQWAAIGGGESNTNNSTYSVIGGGYGNTIQANAIASIIGGGGLNLISSNASSSFIGGGSQNTIQPNAAYSFIGAGGDNTISSNSSDSFIGSGWDNIVATNAIYAFIGGGIYGVASGAGSVVSGGGVYQVTNSNGSILYSYSGNHAGGTGSMVPGGSGNNAAGDFSLAAGRNAIAPYNGDFVWADYQNSAIAATASNQFVVRASGGVFFQTAGAGMTVDGQSVLAGSVNAGQLSGSYTNAVTLTNAGNSFAGNGAGVANVNAAALNGLNASNFWQLGGNNVAAGQFLGSTNNQAVEIWANGQRALRLEPATFGFGTGYMNFIGGSPANYIAPGSAGSVIAGGGGISSFGQPASNTVSGYADFIGGGINNSIQNAVSSVLGGGQGNAILFNSGSCFIGAGDGNLTYSNISDAFLGGGYHNSIQTNANYAFLGAGSLNQILASAYLTFLGGGQGNIIQSNAGGSVLVGGQNNQIGVNAQNAVVAGGNGNGATANNATVPGGSGNIASGPSSFAAGQNAQATQTGSFVWADTSPFNFNPYSLAGPQGVANSFNIRATGGFYVATGLDGSGNITTAMQLKNNGNVTFTSGAGGANQIVAWTPGSGSWSFTSDRNTKDRFAAVNAAMVLAKVATLPIAEWSYKGYAQRHIGAMAQDFHALFPLNDSDTTLNDADLHGVALAAIQGLNQKVEELKNELTRKDTENAELMQRLEKLEQLVSRQIGAAK